MARRATVVGSGPNGLTATVALARAGFEVRVLEAAATVGGGVRSAELTLPGFVHDVCSAVHPAALSSPVFRAFGLGERIEWIRPEASYAQPLDDGRAAIAWREIERTASHAPLAQERREVPHDCEVLAHGLRPRIARGLDGEAEGAGHRVVGKISARSHLALVYVRADDGAGRIETGVHAEAQAHLPLDERAQDARELRGEHRDGAVGQVDRAASRERAPIERAAGGDVV